MILSDYLGILYADHIISEKGLTPSYEYRVTGSVIMNPRKDASYKADETPCVGIEKHIFWQGIRGDFDQEFDFIFHAIRFDEHLVLKTLETVDPPENTRLRFRDIQVTQMTIPFDPPFGDPFMKSIYQKIKSSF